VHLSLVLEAITEDRRAQFEAAKAAGDFESKLEVNAMTKRTRLYGVLLTKHELDTEYSKQLYTSRFNP
jgi:hypothetical protein